LAQATLAKVISVFEAAQGAYSTYFLLSIGC